MSSPAELATSRPSPSSGGSLLAERGFRWLWAGETTSRLGSSVGGVALPLVALVSLHASTFAVALLTAAAWLPWLVIGLPAGAWVDRLPARAVMLSCDIASLVLMASVPVAAALGLLTVAQLLVVALLTGVATVFFETAYQVYLPSLVAETSLPQANALLQGSQSAGQVAGPAIGGLLAQAVGAVTGVLVDALSFAASAVGLLLLRRAPHRGVERVRAAVREPLRREIATGLRFVCGDRYLRVMTVFGACSNLASNAYAAILVAFLVRTLAISPGTVGLVLSAGMVGGLLGAMLAPVVRRRFGTAHGLLLTKIGAGPCTLLIPLGGSGWRLGFVVAGSLFFGLGAVAGNVINAAWRQVYIPRELMGRVIVSIQTLNYGAIPVGAVLGGVGASTLGVRPVMWLATSMAAAAGLILLVGPIRTARDLPLHAHPTAAAE